MNRKILVLAVLLCGTALAQTAVPTTDPSKMDADVGALAATLMFVVQFIKRQFERQSRPLVWWQTLLLTLALGEGISALLFYAGYGARFGNTAPPMAWMLFGLVATAIAAGLKDLLTSLAERNKSDVVVNTAPPLGLPSPSVGEVVTPPAGFVPLAQLVPLDEAALLVDGLPVQDSPDATGAWPAADYR
ncbi:hypothetical protein Dxin01_02784 [Deinococcus xinjiangensis]|uniref:Uncharacterized protein n=1 Tax=Deinococcus xinjiangensis TaxID=457454 RepID=A0ABP9VEQ0_9DEIO